MLPAVLLYAGFFLLPTVGSYWLSLYNWDGIGPLGRFAGLHNFSLVLHDHQFRDAALHNLWIFLVLFVITNTFSLAVCPSIPSRRV